MEFENQFPESLSAELNAAETLRVQPLRIGDPGFDEAINEGTIAVLKLM